MTKSKKTGGEFGLPPEDYPVLREDDRPPLEEGLAPPEAPPPELAAPSPEIVAPGAYYWHPAETARRTVTHLSFLAAAVLVVLVGLGPLNSVLHPVPATVAESPAPEEPAKHIVEPVSGPADLAGGSGEPAAPSPAPPAEEVTVPISTEPEEEPAEEPEPRQSLREFLSLNPNWYAEEYGIYLHFNDSVGWTFDGNSFHRLFWHIEDEGDENERLYAEFGYAYVDGPAHIAIGAFTTEVTVSRENPEDLSLYSRVGVEFDDLASAAFTPVDVIPADSRVVDSFGAMTAQEMFEAIGTFTPLEIDAGAKSYTSASFSDGSCTLSLADGSEASLEVKYPYRVCPYVDADLFEMIGALGGSFSYQSVGAVQIREDGVTLFLFHTGNDSFCEMVSGSLDSITPPEKTRIPILEEADAAFPVLTNLEPNGSVPGYGILNEQFILVDNTPILVGDAWTGTVGSVDGASYDAETNTLTLSNFTGGNLNINLMGNGFTIRLVGDNRLDYILVWGFMYGGSVTFTGDGSLTLNEFSNVPTGLIMNAEASQTCVMVDRGVTLDIYGYGGAVMVYDSTMEKAIYYLSPLRLSGGMRAAAETEYESEYQPYTIIDEYGDPSTHVRFAPVVTESDAG